MAKKPKSRVLRKVWGGTGVVWDGASVSDAALLENESSWETTSFDPTGALNTCLIYRIDYFDLSGYAMNDETLYPQGVRINDTEFLSGSSTGTGAIIKRLDLVCTKIPTVDDLNNVSQMEGWTTPGAASSRFGLDEVVSGRLSRYVQTADIGGFQLTAQTSWGTCAATAGQKLYFVQAYLLHTAVSGLILPGSSLVIPAVIGTEPELEYVMRLARGYEVQGSVS